MRKVMICLVASLITLSAGSAFAQDGASQKRARKNKADVQVGVTGLLGFNTVSYSADDSQVADAFNDMTGYKLGFGGGLRAIIEFTPLIGMQPELLFKQYGASMELDVMGTKVESTNTLNYLHVPLLARVALPFGPENITPKVLAGPTFGYFLSGSSESDGKSVDLDADDVNRLNIGAAAGVGADILAGPGSLSLDLRYDRSFTSNSKDDAGGASIVNTGFSFLIGYNIAL